MDFNEWKSMIKMRNSEQIIVYEYYIRASNYNIYNFEVTIIIIFIFIIIIIIIIVIYYT
jgi:hypothetical protein